jgi:hypothetical protein
MKKLALLTLVAFPLCLSAAEGQRTLKGVTMPLSAQVDGRTLVLNGMGLRTKFFFKVYVAGLYLEKPSSDGAEVASSEQFKRLDLVFLRSVGGKTVAEALAEDFANNAGDAMPALKARIERFEKLIPDVKKGGRMSFVYRPGAGLEVLADGSEAGSIEGKDFADMLFRVWVGEKPADKALKAGLLGNP